MRVYTYTTHADVMLDGGLLPMRVYGSPSDLAGLSKYVEARVAEATEKHKLTLSERLHGISNRPRDIDDRQAGAIRTIAVGLPSAPIEPSTADGLRSAADQVAALPPEMFYDDGAPRQQPGTAAERVAARLHQRANAMDADNAAQQSDLAVRQSAGFRRRQQFALDDYLASAYDPTAPRSEFERSKRRIELLEQKQIARFDSERERDHAAVRARLDSEGDVLRRQLGDWQSRYGTAVGRTLADEPGALANAAEADLDAEHAAKLAEIEADYQHQIAQIAAGRLARQAEFDQQLPAQ